MGKEKNLNSPKTKKLISSKEDKVSYMQILGFILIIVGITGIIIAAFLDRSAIIAMSFFITMLGVAFAFPSLLEGNDGLSTMRIVVFMVVNVICILLLKIGWRKDSLDEIGLNQYWMGVIAFVFGAKATQSYFESKMAVPSVVKDDSINETVNSKIAGPEIIEKYIDLHGEELINSFPNVNGLAIKDKITNNNKVASDVLVFKVTNKIKDLSFGKIPPEILFKDDETNKVYKIITDVEEEECATNCEIIIQDQPFKMGGSISRKDSITTGTLGLLLNKIGESVDRIYALSCYHVFCSPELAKDNKEFTLTVDSDIAYPSSADKGLKIIGNVILGKMNEKSDFAIALLDKDYKFSKEIAVLDRVPSGFGVVTKNDKGSLAKMCGTSSGMSTGRISSYKVALTIDYCNKTVKQYFNNLVEIPKFSKKGDSGAAVLNSEDKVIGLLIADSDSFSYVLPVTDYLNTNNFVLNN